MSDRLTLEALKHEASQNVAVAMMLLSAIGLIGLIFYLKRWKWLWNEWLTTVDPEEDWCHVYRSCSDYVL